MKSSIIENIDEKNNNELIEREDIPLNNIENNNQRKISSNSNNSNNLSNIKIAPLEIDMRNTTSENCENVDILKDNETPLLSINKTSTTKTANSLQEEKNILIYCYKEIPISFLRGITILVMILYILAGIFGVIFFAINREENPFLFCFNFLSREGSNEQDKKISKYDKIIFLSDLNSFCIIHVILLFLFIMLLYTFIKNKENDSKNFFKNFSIFFPLTLLLNIPIYALGIISSRNGDKYYYSIVYIILNLLSSICMMKIYIESKKHKCKNLMRVINQGFLSGLLSAFQLYCLLYNICYLCTWWAEKSIVTYEIIPGVIFFILSFLTIILYNDIFFPVTALIIQIGLLYIKKKNSLILIIFNICAVFFSFVSIILSILKHNKKVFNIFIEGESKKDE